MLDLTTAQTDVACPQCLKTAPEEKFAEGDY